MVSVPAQNSDSSIILIDYHCDYGHKCVSSYKSGLELGMACRACIGFCDCTQNVSDFSFKCNCLLEYDIDSSLPPYEKYIRPTIWSGLEIYFVSPREPWDFICTLCISVHGDLFLFPVKTSFVVCESRITLT